MGYRNREKVKYQPLDAELAPPAHILADRLITVANSHILHVDLIVGLVSMEK